MISETTKTYPYYIACFLFVLTSIQLTFLSPYIVVVQGERSNVFSGILCACTLLAAIIFVPKTGIRVRTSEIIVSSLLTFFAIGSAALSSTPVSSGWRAFVIMSAGLGGYWSSRFILQSVQARKAFVYLSLALMLCSSFLFFLALSLGAEGYRFIDVGYHAISSRILVMSFAPISLVASAEPFSSIIGIGVLVIGYLTLIANLVWGGVSTGPVVAMIVFFVGLYFLWRIQRIRKILVGILVFTLITLAIFSTAIVRDLPKDSQSVAYRIENIFFSTHIAMRHPLFGAGPFAPREEFLNDYDVVYPFLTNDKFKRMTKAVITSENLPLTLMAEFGLPFTLIYGAAICYILYMVFKLSKSPPNHFYPHPLALFLPLVAIVIQFQIFDGIYHPQISWFFHILLGMCFLDGNDADGVRFS